MAVKQTPRPWNLERSKKTDCNYVWRISGQDGYTITRFTGDPVDPFSQDGANARLIVAAPELLVAAKMAYQVMTERLYHGDANPLGIIDLLGSAIIRATGDTTL